MGVIDPPSYFFLVVKHLFPFTSVVIAVGFILLVVHAALISFCKSRAT